MKYSYFFNVYIVDNHEDKKIKIEQRGVTKTIEQIARN